MARKFIIEGQQNEVLTDLEIMAFIEILCKSKEGRENDIYCFTALKDERSRHHAPRLSKQKKDKFKDNGKNVTLHKNED